MTRNVSWKLDIILHPPYLHPTKHHSWISRFFPDLLHVLGYFQWQNSELRLSEWDWVIDLTMYDDSYLILTILSESRQYLDSISYSSNVVVYSVLYLYFSLDLMWRSIFPLRINEVFLSLTLLKLKCTFVSPLGQERDITKLLCQQCSTVFVLVWASESQRLSSSIIIKSWATWAEKLPSILDEYWWSSVWSFFFFTIIRVI